MYIHMQESRSTCGALPPPPPCPIRYCVHPPLSHAQSQGEEAFCCPAPLSCPFHNERKAYEQTLQYRTIAEIFEFLPHPVSYEHSQRGHAFCCPASLICAVPDERGGYGQTSEYTAIVESLDICILHPTHGRGCPFCLNII